LWPRRKENVLLSKSEPGQYNVSVLTLGIQDTSSENHKAQMASEREDDGLGFDGKDERENKWLAGTA